jgi:hypothetical protein
MAPQFVSQTMRCIGIHFEVCNCPLWGPKVGVGIGMSTKLDRWQNLALLQGWKKFMMLTSIELMTSKKGQISSNNFIKLGIHWSTWSDCCFYLHTWSTLDSVDVVNVRFMKYYGPQLCVNWAYYLGSSEEVLQITYFEKEHIQSEQSNKSSIIISSAPL